MAFNPAAVYERKSISLTSSGLVLFTNTDNQLAFSCKASDNIQVSGGYIIVFTESGEFKIDVKPLESIVTPTTTLTYTPSSPTLNTGSGNYARLIDTRFAALANNVFQGCCKPAGPVVIGGLLVEFADYATMIGSAPGSPGVLYMTQDNNQLYRWDGVKFSKVDGYLPYANFSAFPVTGLEGIFYYDEAEKEMYVWNSSLSVYESLCCDATQVVYKHLQVAHGFSVGDVIYVSADGTFALAQADNIATSYVAGFVIEVPNANTFRYVTHGTVTVGVPAFAGGTIMYLSETTAGALTDVAPTSPDIVRPVMMVVDNGSQGIVFLSLVDSSASSGSIPLAGTTAGNPVTGPIQWEDTDGTTYPKVLFYQDDTDNNVRFEVLRNTDEMIFRQSSLFDPSDYVEIIFFGDSGFDIRQFVNGVIQSSMGLLSGGQFTFITPSGQAGVTSVVNEVDMNFDSLTPLRVLKKRFWTKAGAPTASDDDLQGFIVGSLIWDTTNSILYRCTDNTTGAAVWLQVGPVITSGTAAPSGGNDGDIYLQYT